MKNAERFAIGAIVNGLRKSGAIDNAAVRSIVAELRRAAGHAGQYGSAEERVIEELADDVSQMEI